MTGRTDVLVNMPVSARTTAPLQRSGGMIGQCRTIAGDGAAQRHRRRRRGPDPASS
ncbi:hypothetical protein P9209_18965 [Prescottella defluvii]|nr:hypothetical protein P9209_18965 [Prescottella defluvii]